MEQPRPEPKPLTTQHLATRLVEASPRGVRAAFEALLPHMTSHDISWLKQAVRNLTIDGSEYAGFTDLPDEIVVDIFDLLSLKDIITCLVVSKTWRAVLSQKHALVRFCVKLFPGLLELYPDTDLGELFSFAARQYLRPLPGQPQMKPRASIRWPLDDATDLPEEQDILVDKAFPFGQLHDQGQDQVIYNEGMVARLCLRSRNLVVDNLHTGKRGNYWLPGDPRSVSVHGHLLAVSKTLAVIELRYHDYVPTRQLRIYHFEHKAWAQLTMAAYIRQCEARGDEVVFLSGGIGDRIVTKWTWNGTALEFDLQSVDDLSERSSTDRKLEKVMLYLHPKDPGIVWVLISPGHATGYAAAVKLEYSATYGRYKCTKVLKKHLNFRHKGGCVHLNPPSGPSQTHTRVKPARHEANCHGSVAFISFNILLETFSEDVYWGFYYDSLEESRLLLGSHNEANNAIPRVYNNYLYYVFNVLKPSRAGVPGEPQSRLVVTDTSHRLDDMPLHSLNLCQHQLQNTESPFGANLEIWGIDEDFFVVPFDSGYVAYPCDANALSWVGK